MTREAGPGPREVDGLLPLAESRPREALNKARAILRERPGPYEASVAHHAAGIVLREFGDVDAGVSELRDALRMARQTGLVEREVDVLGALGIALVYAGRTTTGLAAFDHALKLCNGVRAGYVLHRRSVVLWTLGQYAAALEDTRRAVTLLRRAGDTLYVNGLYRHGFLLAPALARRAAQALLEGRHFPEVMDEDSRQRRLA